MIKYLLTFILLYIIVSFVLAFITSIMIVHKLYVAYESCLINSEEEEDLLMEFMFDEISYMINGIDIKTTLMIKKQHFDLCEAFGIIVFLGPISAMIIHKRDQIFNTAFLRLLDERG